MNASTHLSRIILAASIFTLSLSSAIVSAEEQSAHEHGAARLTVATNDVGFEISLESPAANIFGFEYMASSDSDHATLQKAVDTLNNGDALFLANESAGCKQTSIEIESAQVEAHDSTKHKDDEKHEEDHEDEAATAHSDVDATWNFTCDNIDAMTQVEIKLFSAFPNGFADLDTDWITAIKSGHIELEADGLVLLK